MKPKSSATLNSKDKPLVAMDLSITGKGGGPYTSTTRIMQSNLKNKYDFKIISYDTCLGRGVSLKRILDLKRQILKLKPDIVHFTGLQLSGFHLAVACKLAGIKNTVVTVRGFSGDMIEFNPIKRILLTFILEPLTLLLTRKVYGVSEFVASRKLLKLFSFKSMGAIYNFPPEPCMEEGRGRFRYEHGMSSTDVVAVSVARINKEKGYHILEGAIKRFQGIPNLKFVIVGEGDYSAKMQFNLQGQISSGQVKFLGYRDDISYILNDCDFFILPTLHETLSVALLEASMAGLALVASNTGGVPEIVADGYNGLLVTPGDVQELVESIGEVYKNNKLRGEFSSNALKRVNEKFSKDSIESDIDTIYQSLLG